MTKRRKAKTLQRAVQALSLLLFFYLLWKAAFPIADSFPPADTFLLLDPSAGLTAALAARAWLPSLLLGLALLLVSLIFGRIFCGYICPLGTTLDLARAVTRRAKGEAGKRQASAALDSGIFITLRKLKYIILAGLLGAALLGVNLSFWASPIPLVTRFYGLLAHPLLLLAGGEGLALAQPLLSALDATSLEYLQIAPRRFDTLYFLLGFFGLLFWLEAVRPRFWCRYLCPAGALMGLFALRPLWRRGVSKCTNCGECARRCPTAAIAIDGEPCAHAECLSCRQCVDVCPVRGISFSFSPASVAGEPARSGALPSRRVFLAGAGAGATLAAVGLSGTHSLLRAGARGSIWSEACIRPPGAVPEPEFLDRCLRCGLCMKACPSNALQPAWLAAGPEGMFSPLLMPRRGPCEPDCNVCGRVCPTRAIAPLPLAEKRWAKAGTAAVLQERCLAYAENKSCVVCQEVCPYGSVKLVQKAGSAVPVPVVDAQRCFGCGYCENHCPVRVPAIVVLPLNALRLPDAPGLSYIKAGKEAGLSLEPRPQDDLNYFDGDSSGGLPPGFTN